MIISARTNAFAFFSVRHAAVRIYHEMPSSNLQYSALKLDMLHKSYLNVNLKVIHSAAFAARTTNLGGGKMDIQYIAIVR